MIDKIKLMNLAAVTMSVGMILLLASLFIDTALRPVASISLMVSMSLFYLGLFVPVEV